MITKKLNETEARPVAGRPATGKVTKSITFSGNYALERLIKQRAAMLGMSQSQYARQLFLNDLAVGGPLQAVVRPHAASPVKPFSDEELAAAYGEKENDMRKEKRRGNKKAPISSRKSGGS